MTAREKRAPRPILADQLGPQKIERPALKIGTEWRVVFDWNGNPTGEFVPVPPRRARGQRGKRR